MDSASSIAERLKTLNELHNNEIHTVLFMSPMFPKITDYKKIIELSRDFVDEYWFENLNLRGSYKSVILSYIKNNYPDLTNLYNEIYVRGKNDYWVDLSVNIDNYCRNNHINYTNYFYHKKLVNEKLNKQK